MKFRQHLATIIATLLALLSGPASAAHAQSHLIRATPGPGATINLPPTEVRLEFDHPLLAQGTSLRVTGQDRAPVEKGDGHIDPANPFALVVSLPILFEGDYTVTYTAATVGSSTILADTYTFTLDLPEPILSLNVPTNGQAFQPGPVPIRLETRFVDFNVYQTRVRLYVDGHLYKEWAGVRTMVDGLLPGVHEIRTVLVQVDQELPNTETTVYIAVQRPDPDPKPLVPISLDAALASLPPALIVGILALVIALLSLGIWLGHSTPP